MVGSQVFLVFIIGLVLAFFMYCIKEYLIHYFNRDPGKTYYTRDMTTFQEIGEAIFYFMCSLSVFLAVYLFACSLIWHWSAMTANEEYTNAFLWKVALAPTTIASIYWLGKYIASKKPELFKRKGGGNASQFKLGDIVVQKLKMTEPYVIYDIDDDGDGYWGCKLINGRWESKGCITAKFLSSDLSQVDYREMSKIYEANPKSASAKLGRFEVR